MIEALHCTHAFDDKDPIVAKATAAGYLRGSVFLNGIVQAVRLRTIGSGCIRHGDR
jgi:hypothetical protein